MAILHLSIDYSEETPIGSYAGIVLKDRAGKEVQRWKSDDPQADWAAYIEWALAEKPFVIQSSSVDHFLHDTPGWRMIEDDRGLEMLVPEDRPEWLAWEAEEFGLS